MAGRSEPVLDDEKRSYGAVWLVCSLLLFVGALWAVVDDNVFRRPWKKYQAEFNTLEIRRLSGEDASWRRVNQRFMNVIRKQFLIWRTLSTEDRERYLAGAQADGDGQQAAAAAEGQPQAAPAS